MASSERNHGEKPGPIAYMASNGVAANLLMVGILVAGVASLFGIELEAWPTVPFNQAQNKRVHLLRQVFAVRRLSGRRACP